MDVWAYLWSMLCHSLWVIPLANMFGNFGIRNEDPRSVDKRMRWAIVACLAGPAFVAIVHVAISGSIESLKTVSAIHDSESAGNPNARNNVDRTAVETNPASVISSPPKTRSLISTTQEWAFSLIVFWLIGTIVMSLRLVGGAIALRYSLRPEPASEEIRTITERLAIRLGLRKPPRVVVSQWTSSPMLAGVIRPQIVLPTAWAENAATDEIEAVLAHESAHYRRNDSVRVWVERAAGIVWFHHPMMHSLNRLASHWRERATDRLAAQATGNRLALARALEAAALRECRRKWSSCPGFGGSASPAMRPGGDLLARIEAILEEGGSSTMNVRRHWKWCLGAISTVLAVSAFALVQAKPFPQGVQGRMTMRPALPIKGEGKVRVEGRRAPGRIIAHDVTLLHVDAEFARTTLRSTTDKPNNHPFPRKFVIVPEVRKRLIAHPSASTLALPRTRIMEGDQAVYRWESPDTVKLALFELDNKPAPEKLRRETVWTDIRLRARAKAENIDLQAQITDFNERFRMANTQPIPSGQAESKAGANLIGVHQAIRFDETAELRPGESIAVILGVSSEPYRPSPRFLYETVLGEQGFRVAQFTRLVIMTPQVVHDATE